MLVENWLELITPIVIFIFSNVPNKVKFIAKTSLSDQILVAAGISRTYVERDEAVNIEL